MSRFELVIFDNDGVLVDTEKVYAHVAAKVYPQFGYPMTVEKYYKDWVAISTKNKLELIKAKHGVSIDLDEFESVYRPYLKEAFEEQIEPMPGAVKMLEELTHKRCVASSAPKEATLMKYDLVGFTGLFDDAEIFSGKDVEKGKPAPDLFLKAAREMGRAPNKCIVVEDAVSGVVAGKAAGMYVVGFTGGSHSKYMEGHEERLLEAGADVIIDDLNDLLEIVENG